MQQAFMMLSRHWRVISNGLWKIYLIVTIPDEKSTIQQVTVNLYMYTFDVRHLHCVNQKFTVSVKKQS